MNYFKLFPVVAYDFTTTEELKQIMTLADVSTRVQSFYNDESVNSMFSDFTIAEYDTPETISYQLYGSTEYYWTIMYVNNLFDIHADWPLREKEIDVYAKSLFPGVTGNPYPNGGYTVEVKPWVSGTYTIEIPITPTYDVTPPHSPNMIEVGDFIHASYTSVVMPDNYKIICNSGSARITAFTKNSTSYTVTLSEETNYIGILNSNILTTFYKPIEKHKEIAYFINPRGVKLFYEQFVDQGEIISPAGSENEVMVLKSKEETIYAVSRYNDIVLQNEKKRRIKVVKPDFVSLFAQTYFSKIIK